MVFLFHIKDQQTEQMNSTIKKQLIVIGILLFPFFACNHEIPSELPNILWLTSEGQ